VITIVVTGPESTGKTLISEYLARSVNALLVPEFARNYISELKGKYTYADIETIARTQIDQRKIIGDKKYDFLILDTWLIITKIWFIEVYGHYPVWIDEAIANHPVDLYLLCEPDVPWISDPVRENGGERRNYLFEKYRKEINKTNTPCELISGINETRFKNALDMLKKHFENGPVKRTKF
jgi:nicotinamide riboside kinase